MTQNACRQQRTNYEYIHGLSHVDDYSHHPCSLYGHILNGNGHHESTGDMYAD